MLQADRELVFCQLSGNNTISYYLGTVLTTAGITSVPTQLAINIGLSVWNLCCAVLGSIYVDKFGRRIEFCMSYQVFTIFKVLTMTSCLHIGDGTDLGDQCCSHQDLQWQ